MQPKKVRRIRLNGESWGLVFADLTGTKDDGYCDPPSRKNRKIWIHDGLADKRMLEIAIHEMLHAVDWHKDEHSFVEPVARDVAKVLWSLGFRRVDEKT